MGTAVGMVVGSSDAAGDDGCLQGMCGPGSTIGDGDATTPPAARRQSTEAVGPLIDRSASIASRQSAHTAW